MTDRVPLVEYLTLGESPHLVATRCVACGATFFDRRNACASCSAELFERVRVPTRGTLHSFTIVHLAAPGVKVPFVAAVVDCTVSKVRANLVNVTPDPSALRLGMEVQLTTFELGTDAAGAVGVGFGFEPVSARSVAQGGEPK